MIDTLIRRLSEPRYQALLLLAAVALVYGHTLDVPWYFDDIGSITDNPAIRDLGDPGLIWSYSAMRFVGYLSFAINYQLGGLEPAGFHLFNIGVHLATGLVIYGLMVSLMRTPVMSGQPREFDSQMLAFCVALLFLVHPLNTQAVTYVVQRLASMSALFYLSTMWLYVLARMETNRRRSVLWVLSALATGLFAVFTKQSAYTLPISLLLLEYTFFVTNSLQLKRFLSVAATLAVLAIGVGALIVILDIVPWQAVGVLSRDAGMILRDQYFAAQMLVIWRYVALFFWPLPQVLDYGITPEWALGDPMVLAAATAHLIALSVGVWLLRIRPLIGFCILFYYIGLSVESSFIPIRDLMVEHRTYLSNFALAVLTVYLLMKHLSSRSAGILVTVCVLMLGILTWQRNELWRDPLEFYGHATVYAPDQPRNWYSLSRAHYLSGDAKSALTVLSTELHANEVRNDGNMKIDRNIYVYWAQLLRANGQDKRAQVVEDYLEATRSPSEVANVGLLLSRGNSHLRSGELDEAEAAYLEILELQPNQQSAKANLGVVAMMRKDYQAAIDIFSEIPDHPVSQANLPVAKSALAGDAEVTGLAEKVLEKSQ